MKRLQIRKWTILICGILLLLLTGYIVSTKLWISSDSGIRTGGDTYLSGNLSDREINVFDNAATVNGETAVIAPGSNGSYTFTIKNTKEFPIHVTWELADENEKKIPMQYRLKTENSYLFGSTKEWIAGENLEKYVIEDQIASGDQREYTLDWEWPFEIDDKQNENDTALGNLAALEEVNYSLHFSFRAEGEGSSEKPTEDEQGHQNETGNEADNDNVDENKENSDKTDSSKTNSDKAESNKTDNNKINSNTAKETDNNLIDGNAVNEDNADSLDNSDNTDKSQEDEKEKITVNAAAKEKRDYSNIPWLWIILLLIILLLILFVKKKSEKYFKTEEDIEKDQ